MKKVFKQLFLNHLVIAFAMAIFSVPTFGNSGVTIEINAYNYYYTFSSTESDIIGTGSNPTLTLTAGETYTFQHNGSGHPFRITIGDIDETITEGNEVTFTIPQSETGSGSYVCTSHGYMTNTISIEPYEEAATTPPVPEITSVNFLTFELTLTEVGGTLEYSTDEGTTWLTATTITATSMTVTIPTPAPNSEPLYQSVQLRQISSDGITGYINEFIDETTPGTPTITSDRDSITIEFSEQTGFYQLSYDGSVISNQDYEDINSNSITIEIPDNTYSIGSISVIHTDVFGNSTAMTNISEIIISNTPAATVVDFLTFEVSIPEASGTLSYSTDNGNTWDSTTSITDNTLTITIPTPSIGSFYPSVKFQQLYSDNVLSNIYTFEDTTSPDEPSILNSSISRKLSIEFSELNGVFQIAYDGSTVSNQSYYEVTNNIMSIVIPDNTYSIGEISVIHTDVFGNTSTIGTNSSEVTIDSTFTLSDLLVSTVGPLTFEITVPEISGTLSYSLDGGNTWDSSTSVNNNVLNISIPTPSIGTFYSSVKFQQTFTDNSVTNIYTYTDNTPPQNPKIISEDGNRIKVEFNETPGVFQYAYDWQSPSGTYNEINSNETYIDLPYDTYEVSRIQLIQTDFFGNQSDNITNTASVVISYIPMVIENEFLYFKLMVGEDHGNLNYSIDNGTTWELALAIDSTTLEFTIPTPNPNESGFYDNIKFQQVDSNTDDVITHASETLTITESIPPENPSIIYINSPELMVSFSEPIGFYQFSQDINDIYNQVYSVITTNNMSISEVSEGTYEIGQINIVHFDIFGNSSEIVSNTQNVYVESTIDLKINYVELNINLENPGGSIRLSLDSGSTWQELDDNNTTEDIFLDIPEGIYPAGHIIVEQINGDETTRFASNEPIISKLSNTILLDPETNEPLEEHILEFNFTNNQLVLTGRDFNGNSLNMVYSENDQLHIQLKESILYNIKNNSNYNLMIYNEDQIYENSLDAGERKLGIAEVANDSYHLMDGNTTIVSGNINIISFRLDAININILDTLGIGDQIIDLNAIYTGQHNVNYQIISGNENSYFSIDAITGEIIKEQEFGDTTSFILEIEAQEITRDNTPLLKTSGQVSINVIASIQGSDQLEFSNASLKIREHLPTGEVIYDINNNLTSTDKAVSGNSIVYSITSGNDDNIFRIGTLTGEIFINDSDNLDFETTPIHSLEIEAKAFSESTQADEYKTIYIVIQLKNIADSYSSGSGIPDEVFQMINGRISFSDDINLNIETGDLVNETIELEMNANSTINAIELRIKKLILGDAENKIINLTNGGQIKAIDSISIGETNGTSGELIIDDSNAEILASADITVGEGGKGTLTISNGRAQVDQDFIVGEESNSEGILNISGAAFVKISRNFNIADEGTATINYTGGTISVSGTMNVGTNGTFSMSNGSLVSEEINIDTNGNFEFNGGTIKTPLINVNGGKFVNSGGTLSSGEYNDALDSISLMNINPLSLSGAISEHINIIGDYVQEYGDTYVSNLSVHLNSESEEDNGKLVVTGTATLDGELTITNATSLTFRIGQIYQIIEAEEILGSFTSLDLPELDSELQWDINSLYLTGTLSISEKQTTTIVPVPVYVYPNPVNDKNNTYIYYSFLLNHNTTLEIYNMFADKIYSETFVSATNGGKAGDNLIQLSPSLLKKLPIGPYFIVLHDGSNVLGRGKFTTK